MEVYAHGITELSFTRDSSGSTKWITLSLVNDQGTTDQVTIFPASEEDLVFKEETAPKAEIDDDIPF